MRILQCEKHCNLAGKWRDNNKEKEQLWFNKRVVCIVLPLGAGNIWRRHRGFPPIGEIRTVQQTAETTKVPSLCRKYGGDSEYPWIKDGEIANGAWEKWRGGRHVLSHR